jgi:hypothetical protein
MDWITLIAVVGAIVFGILVWRLLRRWLGPRPATREEAKALADLEAEAARGRGMSEAARLDGRWRP